MSYQRMTSNMVDVKNEIIIFSIIAIITVAFGFIGLRFQPWYQLEQIRIEQQRHNAETGEETQE